MNGTSRCTVGFVAAYTAPGKKHFCYKVVRWPQKKVLRHSVEHNVAKNTTDL